MFRYAALFLLIASAGAFNTKPQVARAPTKLYRNTKTALKSISYGEASRPYRRTVYSHDDWVKHRSPDRFFRNILSITTSGVYKNISREIMLTTTVATFVVLWNMLAGGYTDLSGVAHGAVLSGRFIRVLTLPLDAFTLSSPSLGLLLGMFRGNENNFHASKTS
jgi:putative membrane protein